MKKVSVLALVSCGMLSALSVFSVSAADFVYATGPVTARRWQSAETPTSFDIAKDQKLEVVVKKDGWMRVRQSPGPKFGWIPEASVTTVAPAGAPAAPAPTGIEGLSPEIQEQLMRQLQQQNGQ